MLKKLCFALFLVHVLVSCAVCEEGAYECDAINDESCNIDHGGDAKRIDVIVFLNGGNNTGEATLDASVQYDHQRSTLDELRRQAMLHLGLAEQYEVDKVQVYDRYGVPIRYIDELDRDDAFHYLFLVPHDEHFIWPGIYIGYTVTLQGVNGPYDEPLVLETISLEPRAFRIDNFLSDQECDDIIQQARPQMFRSKVSSTDREEGGAVSNVRTSSQAWLAEESSPTVTRIDTRVQQLVNLKNNERRELFEPMQVVHYDSKHRALYEAHWDYFDPTQFDMPEFKQGVQRMITVFYYLNDVEEGGHTTFVRANVDGSYHREPIHDYSDCTRGLSVKPEKRMAVMWYNLLAKGHMDGALDPRSMHGGCRVTRGEKYGANKWVHNKVYDPRKTPDVDPNSLEDVQSIGTASVRVRVVGDREAGREWRTTVLDSTSPKPLRLLRNQAIKELDLCVDRLCEGKHVTQSSYKLYEQQGLPPLTTENWSKREEMLVYIIGPQYRWMYDPVQLGHRVGLGSVQSNLEQALITLSVSPRLFLLPKFLSTKEIDALAAMNVKENRITLLRSDMDPLVAEVMERMLKATRLPIVEGVHSQALVLRTLAQKSKDSWSNWLEVHADDASNVPYATIYVHLRGDAQQRVHFSSDSDLESVCTKDSSKSPSVFRTNLEIGDALLVYGYAGALLSAKVEHGANHRLCAGESNDNLLASFNIM